MNDQAKAGAAVPHDPLSDALQRVLLEHTRAQARLARSLHAAGTDVDALEHLMHQASGPSALARHLGISPAAATLLVERLVERGHAERRADPDDGRRTVVSLTDAGRDTVLKHAWPMLQRLDDLARGLTESEVSAVLRYLDGAATALSGLGAGPP